MPRYARESVGEVRPKDAGLSLAELALSIGQPYRTVARWVAAWHALGVPGICVVRARARGGLSYRVSADLPARWLACELPSPHGVAA